MSGTIGAGSTMQVYVTDISAGEAWYTRLLGTPPHFVPESRVREWEIVAGNWLLVVEVEPDQTWRGGRLRLGVADIERAREELAAALSIPVSPVDRIAGAAAWCDFDDPWGNRLGFFQDLSAAGTAGEGP